MKSPSENENFERQAEANKPWLIWDHQEEEMNEWLPSYLKKKKWVRPVQPAPKVKLPCKLQELSTNFLTYNSSFRVVQSTW